MLDSFRDVLERYIPIPETEGPSKLMGLSEAIRKFVRPGMTMHICTTHNRPGAIVLELARQFGGQDPDFTISALGFVSTAVVLVHTGVTRKLISSFTGDSYPTPGPNQVIQRAYAAGKLEVQNWTILTVPMRLLAGAMNLPFIPTQSILGSSMAEENAEWFSEAEDQNGNRIGILRAFQPDLALVHGAAADPAGNIILTPPFGEDAYGAWAAKEGVVATVDKIVSSEFVRRYAHLCRIPSYMVRAVCHAPLGAHPGGLSNFSIPEIESYADDYDFVLDIRKASKTEEGMNEWVKHWITDAPSWDHFLLRLGQQRIWHLKGKAQPDSWESELRTLSPDIRTGPEYSPVEMMVVAAARHIAARIREEKYKTILAGVGASNLSAWLSYFQLREENYECDLMAEIGFYGYVPRPADPFIFNFRNIPTCKMLTGISTIMGVFMSGSRNENIGSIGAAQVDKNGNVNSTKIPGKMYITGSGGANDICCAAREVVVTALQDRMRFVDQVAYISSPGERVRTVISDLGVFEKLHPQGELTLTGYYPREGKSEEESIRGIKDNCGWDLKVRGLLDKIEPPTITELKLLRICDPRRQFLGKK